MIRRLIALIPPLAAVGVLIVAAVLLAHAFTAPSRPADVRKAGIPSRDGALTRELFAAHNTERAKHGKPPFRLDPQLCKAARRHALWMAEHRHMTHFGEGSPFKRMADAGYKGSAMGENIAAGQVDVAAVTRAWMHSPGHRANILGGYRDMGAAMGLDAHGTPYWCVDFGSPGGTGDIVEPDGYDLGADVALMPGEIQLIPAFGPFP